ncbi:MAG: hypothetical protein ACRDHP_10090, partial [Ktedonobacterales bacterium]
EFATYLHHFTALEQAAIADGFAYGARISAFRKLYYDSPGEGTHDRWARRLFVPRGGMWSILIPGAAPARFPPSWSAWHPRRSVMYLRRHQNPRIGSERVDIGHVLVGADAARHPTSIRLAWGAVRMSSNHETATWIGDLSSVVVEYLHSRHVRSSGFGGVRTRWIEHYYDSRERGHSGRADMAGNADSYGIAFGPARTLAASLSAYYTPLNGGARWRYTTFARAIGLGTLGVAGFAGDSRELRAYWQREVFNAALAYAAATGRSRDVARALLHRGRGCTHTPMRIAYRRASAWVVDIFIERMARDVAAERTS